MNYWFAAARRWAADPLARWNSLLASYPVLRRLAYASAVLLFAAGSVWAVQQQPQLLTEVRWLPLVLVALLGVPATVGLNAVRFHICAHLVGAEHTPANSLRVTIASMAANLLPLPGGVVVRLAALKTTRSSYGRAVSVTAALSLLWVGSAVALGGVVMMVWLHAVPLGGAIASLGVALIVAAAVLLRVSGAGTGLLVLLCLLQIAMLAVDAGRTWLTLQAINAPTSLAAAAFMVISSATGAAVGIAPGGLGVREAVAAMLGPVVGIAPEAAFVASGLNRLVGMIVLGAAMAAPVIRIGRGVT